MALADADLDRLQADVTKVFDRLLDEVGRAEPDRVQADTPAAEDRALKRLAVLLDGKVLARPPDDEWTRLILVVAAPVGGDRPAAGDDQGVLRLQRRTTAVPAAAA